MKVLVGTYYPNLLKSLRIRGVTKRVGYFYNGSNRITQHTNYSGPNFLRNVEIHKNFDVDFNHDRDLAQEIYKLENLTH